MALPQGCDRSLAKAIYLGRKQQSDGMLHAGNLRNRGGQRTGQRGRVVHQHVGSPAVDQIEEVADHERGHRRGEQIRKEPLEDLFGRQPGPRFAANARSERPEHLVHPRRPDIVGRKARAANPVGDRRARSETDFVSGVGRRTRERKHRMHMTEFGAAEKQNADRDLLDRVAG